MSMEVSILAEAFLLDYEAALFEPVFLKLANAYDCSSCVS